MMEKDIAFYKWSAISFMIFLLTIVLFVTIYSFNNYNKIKTIATTKTNLEQCAIPDGRGYISEVIWVRDCNSILNNIKNNNMKKR